MTYYDHAVAMTYGLGPWAGSHTTHMSKTTIQKEAEPAEVGHPSAAHPGYAGFAGRLLWLLGR